MGIMKKSIPFVIAVAAGLVAGLALERSLPRADAGGVAQMSGFGYVTSTHDGGAIYQWNLEGRAPKATKYDFETGTIVKRDLREVEAPPVKTADKPPAETPEIHVSGVVWTPDPETRFAIINGKTVREGDVFETRSGKKYKVIEIKKSDDVEYREVE